ncbi:MAG TPA: hypothetical protein PLP29_07430 [Candidatus Ozemobacteraceae bacterium]|nr:hypothetical protein [Candidatus Ozemobacteraceae bacterium]
MSTVSRTHYLVLPSYQVRLIVFLVLIMLIGSLLHGFFLYKLTARSIEEGFFSAHNRLRSTWEVLKPAIVVTNGLSFLLVSLAFLFVTLLLTHRLVGPMFKVAGRLRDLAAGRLDLAPVKLRRGDEGQLLSDSVNELQDKLRSRFAPLASLQKQLAMGVRVSDVQIAEALDGALRDVRLDEPAKTGDDPRPA